MPGYIGAGGVARKVKAVYVGVGGVARKVQAVYAGVNGVARKVWGGEEPFAYTYTGEHTESEITWEGQAYRLITLTGSGTFTVTSGSAAADIWLCGGGRSGGRGTNTSTLSVRGGDGGHGAKAAQLTGHTLQGAYTVSVAGASGISSFGDAVQSASGAGSGGGPGAYLSDGVTVTNPGDGESKYPFGDTANFYCHCAGGGGGGVDRGNSATSGYYSKGGGNGGSNGGAGTYNDGGGGNGGNYGGGVGSLATKTNTGSIKVTRQAGAGSYYGSGGGGGAGVYDYGASNGAAGYQGVVYVRIPA